LIILLYLRLYYVRRIFAGGTMSAQPLRMRRDYGEAEADVNPYLNTAPTELVRLLKKEQDSKKKSQMKEALNAWRKTVPGPFWKSYSQVARKIAKEAICAQRILDSFLRR